MCSSSCTSNMTHSSTVTADDVGNGGESISAWIDDEAKHVNRISTLFGFRDVGAFSRDIHCAISGHRDSIIIIILNHGKNGR